MDVPKADEKQSKCNAKYLELFGFFSRKKCVKMLLCTSSYYLFMALLSHTNTNMHTISSKTAKHPEHPKTWLSILFDRILCCEFDGCMPYCFDFLSTFLFSASTRNADVYRSIFFLLALKRKRSKIATAAAIGLQNLPIRPIVDGKWTCNRCTMIAWHGFETVFNTRHCAEHHVCVCFFEN